MGRKKGRRDRGSDGDDSDNPRWPDFRSDLLALFAGALTIWSGAEGQWGFAAFALIVCAFGSAFQRMLGNFEVGAGPGP